MEFLVDVINVFPDGFGTDAKFISDFLIPEAFCKKTQHLGFPFGKQVNGIIKGRSNARGK